ncbi:MAG: hypothetical protein CSA33_02170 [Desulfobulbus propionicus]|nr:MAG: hypothetical protein CSA33_02170 [Desulfobulbus propionicus]
MATLTPQYQSHHLKTVLSVILVNYNGKSFLDACLRAINRHVPVPHEVLLVDNNSSDGSCDYLKNTWPKVRLIQNKENLGFARGNNLAARDAQGQYLLLLNTDTEMLDSMLPLLEYMEKHPETWIAGGRLRNPDRSVQPSVGYDHTPLRILFSWIAPRTCTFFPRLQLHEKRPSFYTMDHQNVDWVTGAYLLIRRNAWERLGGFDPKIFMYVEDVDLCRRAKEHGGTIAYIAAGDTIHFEGGGKKGLSSHALLSTIDSYRLVLTRRQGTIISTITCSLLALIFFCRAGVYWFTGTLFKNPLHRKKAVAYWEGTWRALYEHRKV